MGMIELTRGLHSQRLKKFARRLDFAFRKATWRDRPLPDFLIVGAQKSGTTSLHAYLSQHPQLFSSPLKKEIHYFDGGKHRKSDSFAKGEIWYRAHFPSQRELSAGSRVFEASPLYLFHPLAAERIARLAPRTKLIALLRNPVERAISHYLSTKRRKFEPLPMLEAFQKEEERLEQVLAGRDFKNELYIRYTYKSRGRYQEQLDRYRRYFPAQQILLLSSEEFFNDPHESLKRVFDFVEVDAGFRVGDVTARNVGGSKDEVPSSVHEYLMDYFRPYNRALYEQTGRDFGW